MTVRTRTALKALFAVGQQPAAADFEDFIDSAGNALEGDIILLAEAVPLDLSSTGTTALYSELVATRTQALGIVFRDPTADVSLAQVKVGTNAGHDNMFTATALGAQLDNSESYQRKKIGFGDGGAIGIPNGGTLSAEVTVSAAGTVTVDVYGYRKD